MSRYGFSLGFRGLSGAGKSTLAGAAVSAELRRRGVNRLAEFGGREGDPNA